MNPRAKRLTGLLLVVIAWLWIGFAQITIWTLPTATASEAPSRHLPDTDTFTKRQAYDLSFGIARDLRNRSPNVLLPVTLLFAGSWLFFTAPPAPRRVAAPAVHPPTPAVSEHATPLIPK